MQNNTLLARLCVALAILGLTANTASAIDGKIYSPQVVKGEAEIEYAGTRTFDSDRTKNDIQENQFSVGYGFTDWWSAEVYYATLERGPGAPMDFTGNEFENIFQFWPIGKYWIDAGLLASYHLAAKRDDADSVEMKLLLQKDIGRYTAVLNVGGERQVGNKAEMGNDLSGALSVRYRWLPYFEPGVEYQSDLGTWDDHTSFNKQGHYAGPAAYGMILPGLKYEVAYYTGISTAAANNAMRLKIEYELFF